MWLSVKVNLSAPLRVPSPVAQQVMSYDPTVVAPARVLVVWPNGCIRMANVTNVVSQSRFYVEKHMHRLDVRCLDYDGVIRPIVFLNDNTIYDLQDKCLVKYARSQREDVQYTHCPWLGCPPEITHEDMNTLVEILSD